jgi:6-phosphogluconate dehydrogenase
MKVVADKYIKSAGLEELMRVNENGRNIKILVKSGSTDSQIRELLMFIEGAKNDDTVLMSLTGNFDLNEISVLTDKMRIPGGDDLKKATKGKK